MMPKPIPDRLIDLVGQWCSPYRWQTMAREWSEAQRDRKTVQETKEFRYKYPDHKGVADDIISHHENFGADSERRFSGYVSQLQELSSLLEQHAPELLGHLPNVVAGQVPTEAELVSMRQLLGHVEARGRESPKPLKCNTSDMSVYLGEKRLAVGLDPDVFAYVSVLNEAFPTPVTFAEMQQKDTQLQGANQTRLMGKLPRGIDVLIERIPGKGHVLKLPL